MFLSQLNSKIRIYSILVAIAWTSLFDDLVLAGLNRIIVKILPTTNNVNYQKNILYVSHRHKIYAKHCRGMNAYLTAINTINNSKLLCI